MHKGIILYVAILVALVAIVVFGFFGIGGVKTSSSSSSTTTVGGAGNATTTVVSSSSVPTTVSTTMQNTNYTSCLSSKAAESIPNGNFSSGTYAFWNSSGPGFGLAPFNLTSANANGDYYNHTWNNYNGIFFATTYQGGSALQVGNLTSDNFTVTEPFLNFRIISPQNALLYVEVLSGNRVLATAHYNTFNTSVSKYYLSTFQNASIPLVNALCKQVQIRVVAGIINSGSGASQYQYIAVGDFYMGKGPVQAKGIVVNQTVT
ncbi:MAG: hypothetical protein KGI00_03710 [Candidatus Micrarchaeota archaeon]|nr:hypothetical protein [Candidatus Micrarchaeota archaeon]MDE1823929.1 hypothetical protein [Candidatus Micrarchaeota archaeon]MDE1849808.1 hypothetical protein [Candidatus Micrarchaeota archaeon]